MANPGWHLTGFDFHALAQAFMHFGEERCEVFSRKFLTSAG